MEAMTETTIRCRLDDDREVVLDADDCATLLNAMARSHLLQVLIADLPSGDYATIWSEEACAWSVGDGQDEDAKVFLEVNAGLFTSATPREKSKKTKARKTA